MRRTVGAVPSLCRRHSLGCASRVQPSPHPIQSCLVSRISVNNGYMWSQHTRVHLRADTLTHAQWGRGRVCVECGGWNWVAHVSRYLQTFKLNTNILACGKRGCTELKCPEVVCRLHISDTEMCSGLLLLLLCGSRALPLELGFFSGGAHDCVIPNTMTILLPYLASQLNSNEGQMRFGPIIEFERSIFIGS